MPHEETRKIVKVGNSLAVTLPVAWVRYFKLKPKDEVTVVSSENVVIYPPNVQPDANRWQEEKRRMWREHAKKHRDKTRKHKFTPRLSTRGDKNWRAKNKDE